MAASYTRDTRVVQRLGKTVADEFESSINALRGGALLPWS
jgi:hypothetical protein